MITSRIALRLTAATWIMALGCNLAVSLPCEAAAPQAGEVLKFTLQTEQGPVELSLRYCPAGKLTPGKPAATTPAVDLEPFFIMETEVTRGDFRKIAGAEIADRVKARAGKNLKDLAGQRQLPVFSVDFDDVAAFCRGLEKLLAEHAASQGSVFERYAVRLPTHYEWQYACRAKSDPTAATQLPHFNAWPRTYRALPQVTQRKCEEEWQAMGRQDKFTGSQEQVAEILSKRWAPNNPKPLQIFRDFMKVGIGVDRDYAIVPDPYPLGTPKLSKPNAWNIYDMHNNVREWVLTSRSQSDAANAWAALTQQDRSGELRRGHFFLAGGSFIDTAEGQDAWTKFSVWGGFKSTIGGEAIGLDPATGRISPFNLIDIEQSDLLSDQQPGFRVVVLRVLRQDWLHAVRSRAILSEKAAPEELASFAQRRAAAGKLQGGLSSGEGLIWAVRNPVVKSEPIREGGRRGAITGYEDVIVDQGIADKRLLVLESEFGSVLKVVSRERNTLSAIIRQAWDTGNLQTLTKNSPAVATGAHISIVGHITRDELRRLISETDMANGLANRFLWLCVRRSKSLPEGGSLRIEDLEPLARRVQTAVEFAQGVDIVRRNDDARAMWREVYPALSEGKPGLLGAATSRAEAQVMRLAMLYALLDGSGVIRKEHLLAGLAMWEYPEQSARYVFGGALGDPVADEIMKELRRRHPEGMSRTDLRDLFGRNKKADQINRALELLFEHHLVRTEPRQGTGGRPAEYWFARV